MSDKSNIISRYDITLPDLDKLPDTCENLERYDNTEFTTLNYSGYDRIITTDFTGQRIKNGHYLKCQFPGNSFRYAGASDSYFYNCRLVDCEINGANMQFCDFSESKLISQKEKHKMIQASNLNQSSFNGTTFLNVSVENTSISHSQFIETSINNCHFSHATLQENIFKNVIIENSSFTGCNMEYSSFINISLQNVILPFHQIPYIFGGLEAVQNKSNTVKITSSMDNAPILSAEEYIKIMPSFLRYYLNMNEYFPVVNIYLFFGKIDCAKIEIKKGLQECIRQRHFRKLKALCRLASDNEHINRHFLSELYFNIVQYFMSVELSESERYQYSLHIDEIKNILFDNNREKAHILLALKTNHSIAEEIKLSKVISIIEDCLLYSGIEEDDFSIEIKHNSPPISLWINAASQNPNLLVLFIGIIDTITTGNYTVLTNAIAVGANLATIATFLSSLTQGQSSSNLPHTSKGDDEIIKYALHKHKTLKSQHTKLSLNIGNLHFNYQNTKKYH